MDAVDIQGVLGVLACCSWTQSIYKMFWVCWHAVNGRSRYTGCSGCVGMLLMDAVDIQGVLGVFACC